VGEFTPSQLVQDGVLQAERPECPSRSSRGVRICNTVRGTGFNNGVGSGLAANPHFIWTGTRWALDSVNDAPMDTLNYN
jgi:hypothetical protein